MRNIRSLQWDYQIYLIRRSRLEDFHRRYKQSLSSRALTVILPSLFRFNTGSRPGLVPVTPRVAHARWELGSSGARDTEHIRRILDKLNAASNCDWTVLFAGSNRDGIAALISRYPSGHERGTWHIRGNDYGLFGQPLRITSVCWRCVVRVLTRKCGCRLSKRLCAEFALAKTQLAISSLSAG